MAAVTKGALKAIKFYKHVVQSVEKFIQKVNDMALLVGEKIFDNYRGQFYSFKYIYPACLSK